MNAKTEVKMDSCTTQLKSERQKKIVNRKQKQKKNNGKKLQYDDINSTILIIPLNVNGLNSTIIR